MHLGLIGYGNITRTLIDVLARENAALTRLTVLVRPGREAATHQALAGHSAPVQVVSDGAALVAASPDLVVECAGHSAVQADVTACLRAGIETVIVSIGALADEALHEQVLAAARDGRTRVVLPAGAIGGVDLLSALRPSGITEVTYTSRKPPLAWRGTPAETLLDLPSLTDATVFFSGNARDAALQYPKNANVAATLALAGIGFEGTQVQMIADPQVTQNIHEYSVRAGATDYTMRIQGNPSPDNPKTSVATVYSAAREVLNRLREVAI
ncbi:aspartate dehydrogenase [Pararhodobacter sp.]|uniref:aspartate dehydrogenase n=1 Tax=Pararhodobacter sp. TaxID=2127056 RepID=UPI002AFEE022|nr:aspartate dehydrogenase [Pararhodobacter sp.]